MTAYLTMFVWLGACKYLNSSLSEIRGNKHHEEVSFLFAFVSISYIVIVIGLRNGVGDTPAYISMFNDLPSKFSFQIVDTFKKDKGFFLLSTFFKCFISDDFHLWLLSIACISGGCIAYGLKCYSEDYLFSLLLFLLTVQFVWMMNGIRQFIAVTILFANSHLIVRRKIIPFLLLVLFLSSIHITALIMIPIYFMVWCKPFSWKMISYATLILVIGLSIDRIAESFSFVLEDSSYEGYIDVMATSAGSSFFRALVAAGPPILAYICRKYIYQADVPIINVSVNMTLFSAICYYIASISGGILIGRIPIYFDVYNLILLPWLIRHSFTRFSQKFMTVFLILLYTAYFISKCYIGMDLTYYSDILIFL